MSTLLVLAISLLSGLVTFGLMIAVSVAAEAVEKAVQWVQRLGKAECKRCRSPIPKEEDFCDRHRHLGPIRRSLLRRSRPAAPRA